MHTRLPSVSQVQGRARLVAAVSKFLRMMIFLIIFVTWVTGSSATLSAEGSFQTGSSVQSGGAYVLTLQPAPTTAPTSYVLLETAPQADPASGCCCKICLPSILK